MSSQLAIVSFGLLLGWVITCIIVLIAPNEEKDGRDYWS